MTRDGETRDRDLRIQKSKLHHKDWLGRGHAWLPVMLLCPVDTQTDHSTDQMS